MPTNDVPRELRELEDAVSWTANMIAETRGQSVEFVRRYIDRVRSVPEMPPGTEMTDVTADGVPGLRINTGSSVPGRVIMYFHGGGFQFGSARSHAYAAASVSLAARASSFVVDYRLAPEHLFPSAIEDCTRAYSWLLAQGVKASSMAFVGDSAGGNLVVSVMLNCRRLNVPLPACGVCLSPWVNLVCDGETIRTNKEIDPSGETDSLAANVRAYLGTHDPRDPLASPVYADLAGLPPLLIQVGTREILLDDSRRLAQAARAASVPVVLEEWPGMIHNWQMLSYMLSEGARANARIGAFVADHVST